MYKVKKGFEGLKVSVGGKFPYYGLLKDAPSDVLEHMYHIGVDYIEKGKNAPKSKKIDNLENEPIPTHKDDAE